MEVLKKVNSPEFLSGGGEMGERIRQFDWSTTPLGKPESWEQSLKTCVRILLTSPQPMFVWWGDELINIYNDAYGFILGEKHPDALGKSGNEIWKEIWHEVWKRGEIVFTRNEGTFDEGLLLVMNRFGYSEETYFKFSYNPIPGDNGGTKGLFCACTEETERIINNRSLETLARLSSYAIGCQHEGEVFEKAVDALATNLHDFPFSLIYKIDPDTNTAHLSASTGVTHGHPAAPQIIDMKADAHTWPISKLMVENEPFIVNDLQAKFGSLPLGNWDIPPKQAVLLPVCIKGDKFPSSILIAGLNPYRKVDDKYRGLIMLVIEQLSQTLLNVGLIEAERKRMEDIRNRVEKQLRDFFMQTPIAIAMLRGENFVIELANRRVLEFWDRKESEVIGKPIFEALDEVAGQGLESLLRDVMHSGVRYIDEERAIDILRNSKLTQVFVKFIYEPLIEDDGSISGVIVMVDEITDQVNARKEIERNATELQQINRELNIAATLTQSIADAVIGTDMNYHIISWNQGAQKLYGFTEAEMMGKPGLEMLKTEFLSKADRIDWQEKLDSVGWWQGEVIQYKKDGTQVPVMVSLAYVKDSDGHPIAAVAVNRDITEQKAFAQKLEEMVKERTFELKRSNDELKSFNYIASHDLQEPLRKIQIFIDLLQRHREDPSALDQYLLKIKDSSRRMSQLIQSVLDYSRLSYTDEAYQAIDLNKILADVLIDYELIIKEKNATIESQQLPIIRAIPYQMHQLFANFISNSLKFNIHTPEIKILARKVMSHEVPGRESEEIERVYVQLTFSDNGIGFEREYSEKIMQLFQRLHNKAEYPGSGVGLSIVKKIVDHHQGVINARSEKSRGAAFTVWLPV